MLDDDGYLLGGTKATPARWRCHKFYRNAGCCNMLQDVRGFPWEMDYQLYVQAGVR